MVQHKCTQEGRINDLANKTSNLMDLVKNTNEKVEKIYWYIFEGWMENKYATKEEAKQIQVLHDQKASEMKTDIEKHQQIIDRLVWIIVSWVVVAGLNIILAISK
jgi:mevalonate pyrophosphate decarboxylase